MIPLSVNHYGLHMISQRQRDGVFNLGFARVYIPEPLEEYLHRFRGRRAEVVAGNAPACVAAVARDRQDSILIKAFRYYSGYGYLALRIFR
jgi:hypothetical protein